MKSPAPKLAVVLRPWHRFLIQREIEAARASISRASRLSGSTDDQSRYGSLPCEGGRCVLHVVACRGRSLEAVNHLERRIVSRALRAPRQWLFLIDTSTTCPGDNLRDQYWLATSIARRLHISAPLDPFAAITHEEVIRAAIHSGLPLDVTPEDLYAALCYDCLPKRRDTEPVQKGLESAKIHEALHPRREAMRLLRQNQWGIGLARLEGVVTHVLHRIETESPWVLDEFYDNQIRPMLAGIAQDLNRQRLKHWLEQHPLHESVLVMMDEQHLPLRMPGKTGCAKSAMTSA